jgi:hypothetical protein
MTWPITTERLVLRRFTHADVPDTDTLTVDDPASNVNRWVAQSSSQRDHGSK